MTAYYNEFDPFAAAWLQKLIAAGHIAPGVVDTRDLWDVTPDDLRGFTQVHLCAGIGVWSYALRRAGWSDDRPIWSASFPCQPFSAAGKGLGFADERHLWPAGLHLIEQCDPTIVVGEQVASKDGLAWLDLVRADVERTGRSFAAADLCAAGVGAPHIRQRSFWVAHASSSGRQQLTMGGPVHGVDRSDGTGQQMQQSGTDSSSAIRLADTGSAGSLSSAYGSVRSGESGAGARNGQSKRPSGIDGLAQPVSVRRERGQTSAPRYDNDWAAPERTQSEHGGSEPSASGVREDGTGPTNGFWRDADWLYCRDGKWRPVEPGTFPLAHGATNRVGRLRGYGNAIVAPVAETFIRAMMDSI